MSALHPPAPQEAEPPALRAALAEGAGEGAAPSARSFVRSSAGPAVAEGARAPAEAAGAEGSAAGADTGVAVTDGSGATLLRSAFAQPPAPSAAARARRSASYVSVGTFAVGMRAG